MPLVNGNDNIWQLQGTSKTFNIAVIFPNKVLHIRINNKRYDLSDVAKTLKDMRNVKTYFLKGISHE